MTNRDRKTPQACEIDGVAPFPTVVTSVNGERMLAEPAVVDGTPGWMSVDVSRPRRFWGRRYVSSVDQVRPDLTAECEEPCSNPMAHSPCRPSGGALRVLHSCARGHDRSAGRWCAECEQFGSHHTDRHADFACCIPTT